MFTYDEKKNTDGAQITGVPLADITKEQFDAYPEPIQAAIKSAVFYAQPRPTKSKKVEEKSND